MKTFWIILACGLTAAVLFLGCGLTLLGCSRPSGVQVEIIHQDASFVTEGEEASLNYTVSGCIVAPDLQIVSSCKMIYFISQGGREIWSKEAIVSGDFYLHRQLPLSELGLSSSVSLDDLEFGCKVTEFQLHPIYDTWHFIGELLVLLGAGFLIATLVIAFKGLRSRKI